MAPLPPSTTTTTTYHHPSPRNVRRGQEDKGSSKKSQPERSLSFHGRTTMLLPAASDHRQMQRPKTLPDLLADGRRGGGGVSPEISGGGARRVPTKVLVNVTVRRSLGAVQVMASTEWTVGDLVAAAVRLYVKEERRPPLPTMDPSALGLHYSQFSLECLDPKEKLIGLGSRNFFLCPKSGGAATTTTAAATAATAAKPPTSSSSSPSSSFSCSNQAEKASNIGFPWLRFMDFLL